MDITIQDFAGILVVGSLTSILLQYLKNHFGANSVYNKLAVVLFSIVVGSIYVFVRETAYWETIVSVLMTASTFYALVLKKSSVEEA